MKPELLIQVICTQCRETMTLEGTNKQGSAFECPTCGFVIVVRLKKVTQ